MGYYRDLFLSTFGSDVKAYWALDETSGTSATDASGNGQNGTYVNTSNITLGAASQMGDSSGTSADFLGTNGRMDVADSATISPTAGITIVAWINADTYPGTNNTWRGIVTKQSSFLLRTIRSSGGVLTFNWYVFAGGAYRQATGTLTPSTTTRYCVIGAYDGSTGALYTNGAADGSGFSFAGTVGDSTTTLQIASEGSANYFDGRIDEVAMLGRGITATEAANLYQWGIWYPTPREPRIAGQAVSRAGVI